MARTSTRHTHADSSASLSARFGCSRRKKEKNPPSSRATSRSADIANLHPCPRLAPAAGSDLEKRHSGYTAPYPLLSKQSATRFLTEKHRKVNHLWKRAGTASNNLLTKPGNPGDQNGLSRAGEGRKVRRDDCA